MNNLFVKGRNKAIMLAYKSVLKPIFFSMDPENVHDKMVSFGKTLGASSLTRGILRLTFGYTNPVLEQDILGIRFRNPVGLAAGFDKNAELHQILPGVGFGFGELGSITGYPCEGNFKPRLWRLRRSKGLVVYYGLKNKGCEIISNELRTRQFDIPIGISVAMTNCRDNVDVANALNDYAKAFTSFQNIGEYITVNISCPNAEGGQPFVDPEKLNLLLGKLDNIEVKKPVFVKISPDLNPGRIDEILSVLKQHRVHGIICSNLTKKRSNPAIIDGIVPEKGGISGAPVRDLSDNLISYIYKKEKDRFVIIGCGGIFNARDAYKKIRAGASLVQMITGMIFEGPQVISEINMGLVKLLKKDGYRNVKEAVGADVK
ncbi:MAG: dihydroorotate dehydrogenase (quinone) [Candidatus Taylorbacteria bacterium RIFCSPLOWO2_12_FULL_43_20]|uniref:Dihydroorotate dehydrogenase (quinone) n=1 Tax=Candidatus Taylorbacteria bacterium RIFCSPLOWO2_12_FULL_43_20 TaxID=1802332 RepID=A0A1G2P2P9_9BACT|nr:MAG: dihydroorotate dehydrogenase (quinone) [Candidatus Taylorbacteria bacterium RIFCSPHIGHO2_01_FULL_43_120]OHA22562.1 MAG: dihydroorotate dehydrogenase (quinone) [Candidatus Taylorbacteria bacterium RIFCSPHIGHO2_02_FULL_43_55]OHA28596.1 MAG: dihydroorotate dehydrogenase (quinone) [Candidatus Taylorbacteria bacterium RIFCSPHIGHO2_12_FULL_42_34]OHA30510.1 MAG: dihydroorotate dehydrogenase (quinone) [Candidatus Taylorbacteria bacterium RIFCSPLOWO2_01_FULL_43_83]OHA38096.1 MAG: dihydroorotate 